MRPHPPSSGGALSAEPSDAELLSAIRAGDRSALEALLVRHAPRILRYARRMCDDAVEADDVAQETLIAAARRLPELRDDAALTTWLYTVTRSFCGKKRRRSVHAPTSVVPVHEEPVAATSPGPDDTAAGKELTGALEQAIRTLDPKYREVLVLRDVEGLTAPEVAKVLDLDVDAVKTRLHRARASVRGRLAPILSSGPAPACPDVVERFSRYLEGDIGAAECDALQAHVASCASCTAACASLRRTVAMCHAAGPEVPADVQERVREALKVVVRPS